MNYLQTRPIIIITILAAFYSYLPLVLDIHAFPPGTDPLRLQEFSDLNDGYYIGWWPIKVIGVTVYYYSTYLWIWLGLLIFWQNWKLALISWIAVIFISPAIMLNMQGGTFIAQISFFVFGLATIRMFTQYLQTKSISALILSSIAGFLLTIVHNETGLYIALGLLVYIALSKYRLRIYLALPIVAGILFSTFVMDSGKIRTATNALAGDADKFAYVEGLERPVYIPYGTIQDGSGTSKDEGLIVKEDEFIEFGIEWWTKIMLLPSLLPLAAFVIALYITLDKKAMALDIKIRILLCALPVMMFFAWSPYAINGFRIGIYIMVILTLTLSYMAYKVWLEYKSKLWFDLLAKAYLIMAVVGAANNSILLWMITKASTQT